MLVFHFISTVAMWLLEVSLYPIDAVVTYFDSVCMLDV